MRKFIDVLNLLLGLAFVATVIVYASIIIPLALVSVAGFALAWWIFSHLADGIDILWRRLRRFTR